MKKQFFRVKQLADQTFLRAEKSEVFNKELQIADQKVEYFRSAISAIGKKIGPNNQLNDNDKRMKKCLEYQLGTVFLEESRPEKELQLFQYVLKESGRVELELAKEYVDHEIKVEEMVCVPLHKVLENEFPNILKQKRNLNKYLLDKDSAVNRYNATKKEALKDDMDEADLKVEQSRDMLAIEMFGLLARENEFSTYILQFLKLQRGYHESALKILETLIPDLEKKIGDSAVKRVFGTSLQEHLRVTGKKIAYPLEVCITQLLKRGMFEEGLLRIAGGMCKVKRLKSSLDSGCFSTCDNEYDDVHVLASTLKLYLRDLPEPLLTFHMHNEWMKSMTYPENQRLEVVKNLIAKLPQENRDNLTYLIQFLAKLADHKENKMTSSNIAIVMSPNLLWNKNEDPNVNMSNFGTINMLVELFITEVNTLFPEDVSKYVTLEFEAPHRLKRADFNASTETINLLDSPKPSQRKKKTVAPEPPNNMSKMDHHFVGMEKSSIGSYYPSGSSTLNRPQKSREPQKVKTTVGVNTDENAYSLCRRKSFTKDDSNTHMRNQEPPQPQVANLVNLDDTNTANHKYVTQPAANIQVSKAKPVQPIVAQNAEGDKTSNFKTTVTHQVAAVAEVTSSPKPVAAPRTIISAGDNERVANPVVRSSSNKVDKMSQSLSAVDEDVVYRKAEQFSKPEIPARPSSLQKRSSVELDPALQKTQCAVYNLANKQQPSFVNIQNRNEKHQPGHDNQIAEKERFLGHQPDKRVPMPRLSLEAKLNDINSNSNSASEKTRSFMVGHKPEIPPKSLYMKSNEKMNKSNENLNIKSNEKLDDSNEQMNGNQKTSHVRTRSMGNIELVGSLPHTPPSPRSCNKPTQPPPPPPCLINKVKTDSDSTDL